MAERNNQKLKILYLMKILQEKTDEDHRITMDEILASLAACGITAERKSIYGDLEYLRQYGMDIIGEKENRTYYYHLGKRPFELAELKLLVDSVQASRFITAAKSDELIKKLESLGSRHEAQKLQRQVFTAERIKADNEHIFYNVDAIHEAIADRRQIRFQYFNWNVKKEQELRHGGAFYKISPWALSFDNENYYMIGYDAAQDMIKHFRVDKMLNIKETDEPVEGKKKFEHFDMGIYAKKMFGMFDGDEEMVRLECVNNMAGVIIDRFGREVSMRPVSDTHFRVNVRAAVSRQFLSWIIGLGDGVKIVGPDRVVQKMQEEVRQLAERYLSD